MSHEDNESKRNEGKGEEIGGKIRAGVGRLLGNQRMVAEGKAKELEGKAKQEAADAAERKAREAALAAENRIDSGDDEILDDDEEALRDEALRGGALDDEREVRH